jgi:hypothetical protein
MRALRWGAWTLASIILPASAGAQRLVDIPIHTTATADAVVTGLSALFWNPAGLSVAPYRGSALVLSLNTPSEFGVTGIVGAGAYRNDRLTVGAAWEHVGIDDIPETGDSPTEAGEFSLGEDHFTAAAALALRPQISVGAIAHYIRDDLDDSSGIVALGVGFQARMKLLWPAAVGAFVVNEGDEVVWSAGAESALPPWFGPSYSLFLSYGTGRDAHTSELDHRIAARFDWADRASVSAGVTRQTGAGDVDWAPLLAASLRLTRYTLGVVRESLAQDFGATWSFRLQVGIGP